MKRFGIFGACLLLALAWGGCRTTPSGPVLTPTQTVDAYTRAMQNADLDELLQYSSQEIRRSLNATTPERRDKLSKALARAAQEHPDTHYQTEGQYILDDRASVVLKITWPGGSNTMEVPLVRESGVWVVDTML